MSNLAKNQETFHKEALLRGIWSPLNPLSMKGIFVVLHGYIDESISKNNRVFALSALVGIGEHWEAVSADWNALIHKTNTRLARQGRKKLTRYHAADCNALANEFCGWTKDEQIELTREMLNILNRHALHTVSYTVDLKALANAVPSKDPIGSAYAVCTLFLVYGIGRWLMEKGAAPETRIALIHDRCDYDGVILHQFNVLVKEPEFKFASFFSSCTPMGWEDCIPLQAADLFAYENMKDTERIFDSRARRKTLSLMISDTKTGFRNRFIDTATINNMSAFLAVAQLPEKRQKRSKKHPTEYEAFSDALNKINR